MRQPMSMVIYIYFLFVYYPSTLLTQVSKAPGYHAHMILSLAVLN